MNILVIGSGGREHCLAWKLSQSDSVEKVYVAPGNGGTEKLEKGENLPISSDDTKSLIEFAANENIILTVVGPEAPLVDGLADAFRRNFLDVFGPGDQGAQLEGSKSFAKNFMRKYSVPTPDFEVFDNADKAEKYLNDIDRGMVIKASGLAAGKGVIVCETKDENLTALNKVMREKAFGDAGNTVVIEERLDGFEASLMIITDSNQYVMLPYVQDHKRLLENDEGPNTGGMGVFCPTPRITPELDTRIRNEILRPTLKGIRQEFKGDFRGMLYIGLMITLDGPRVLEYNVRFGDPETQAVLPLCDIDLFDTLMHCSRGSLHGNEFFCVPTQFCLGVVVASDGYPGSYAKGIQCDFLDDINGDDGLIVFHAGTERSETELKSSGGRVAVICSVGDSLGEVRDKVYGKLDSLDMSGFVYRRDIASGLG